jgi:hypothetical protein
LSAGEIAQLELAKVKREKMLERAELFAAVDWRVMRSGDMGPLIPSSGVRYPIAQSDWELDVDAGDYFVIISNQDLPFAGFSDIILQCYDAGGHEVTLDTTIDRDGNVTIRSNNNAAMCAVLLLASYIAHNGARYYFTGADWAQSLATADYYLTIQHNDLPFEGSTDLIMQCYNNLGKLVYIDASVSAAGDLTIRSNNPFPGKL